MSISTTPLPPPLSAAQFYILLALAREERHGYAIAGATWSNSLGSVLLPSGRLYPTIKRLCSESLIDPAGSLPVGKSGQSRMHYVITHHGRIRLQEELSRMKHAVAIGEHAGLLDDTTPTDIQRLLLELEIRPYSS
jgi:PadR family transcriptional regulator, regulatory protein PadR